MGLATKFTASLLLSLLIVACSRTTVRSNPISDDVFRLAASNQTRLQVKIVVDSETTKLGSQYGFVVLPLGEVSTPDIAELIHPIVYRELALRGIKPIPVRAKTLPTRTIPALTISVHELDLVVYDWLFTRRIVGRVRLSGTVSPSLSQHRLEASDETSEFFRYGFEKELSFVLEKTLTNAIDSLCAQLDLREIKRGTSRYGS